MKQLSKYDYQRRSTLVTQLVELIQLNQNERVGQILCYLSSRHGKDKNPYYMTDNELLGVVEKELNRLESENEEDDE